MQLQDPVQVLYSTLAGEVKIDFSPLNVVRLGVSLNQNRLNHEDNLPEDGAGTEEGVVVLTLVSLDPEGLKNQKCYFVNPTLEVKQSNQLGVKQTVNLVKENLLKFKQTVKLVKLPHRSETDLTQTPDFVQLESSCIEHQKTIKQILVENTGQLLNSMKMHKPRPQ